MWRSLEIMITLKCFINIKKPKDWLQNTLEIIGREELRTLNILRMPFRNFPLKKGQRKRW